MIRVNFDGFKLVTSIYEYISRLVCVVNNQVRHATQTMTRLMEKMG